MARENRYQQYLAREGLPGSSLAEREWAARELASKLTEIGKRNRSILGPAIKLDVKKESLAGDRLKRGTGGFGGGRHYGGGRGYSSTGYNAGSGLVNWRIGY